MPLENAVCSYSSHHEPAMLTRHLVCEMELRDRYGPDILAQ
jgi:hypothetical protein